MISEPNLILGLVAVSTGLFVMFVWAMAGWEADHVELTERRKNDHIRNAIQDAVRRTPDTAVVPVSAVKRGWVDAESEAAGW